MTYRFTIMGRLPSLNEYIAAERSNRYRAAKMKRENEDIIVYYIRQARIPTIKRPVLIRYHFFEQSQKRDKDNISGMAHKFIQDALVAARVLEGDGWAHIAGYLDNFSVDKKLPRIEVEITEV